MTDKQIIIDGVDVSGCEFYLPYSEKCECIVDDNGNNNLFCREYRDCYYKRMYHTGQEKDIYKNENKELYKQLKRKEQECEELKEKLIKWLGKEGLRQSEKEFYEQQLDQLKAENKHLNDLLNQALKELEKTRETLTEIKPILEYYANSTVGEEQEDGTYRIELSHKYGSSNMYGAPCYYKYNPKPARQALQKISEVEYG